MSIPIPDQRPIIIGIAGPNGAGKSTFYHAHLSQSGLLFVNPDVLSLELSANPYEAAEMATAMREQLCVERQSFVFETVFSDPAGDKLAFLKRAASSGYEVVLIYIGVLSPSVSDERVGMRVTQGGHDVPSDKIYARYPRSMQNLKAAIAALPHVIIYDNSNLSHPFRFVAAYENGKKVRVAPERPDWFRKLTGERPKRKRAKRQRPR